LLCKTRPMFQSEHIGDFSSESLRLELAECSGWNIVFSVPVGTHWQYVPVGTHCECVPVGT
jgi:hypothetical protein